MNAMGWAVFVALALAGLVMTAFVVAYWWRSGGLWWRHERTPAHPRGRPNTMGRALMALGVTWALELDATVFVGLVGGGPWAYWAAIIIHLAVAAAGVNLLRLLFRKDSDVPRKEGTAP